MASSGGRIERKDAIQGRHFLAIQKSVEVFERRKVAWTRFDVHVLQQDGHDYVVLIEGEGDAKAREYYGVKIGDATELDDEALHRLMSQSSQVKEHGAIHGTSLQAIRAAHAVFVTRSPNTDLLQYQIEVLDDGHALVVTFTDKDREEGSRGNRLGRPGLEITLDPLDWRVVGSHFIR